MTICNSKLWKKEIRYISLCSYHTFFSGCRLYYSYRKRPSAEMFTGNFVILISIHRQHLTTGFYFLRTNLWDSNARWNDEKCNDGNKQQMGHYFYYVITSTPIYVYFSLLHCRHLLVFIFQPLAFDRYHLIE